MAQSHPDLSAVAAATAFGAELRQVIGYLDQGISAHISGPPLSGRSGFLRAAGQRLVQDGRAVLRISGNAALRTTPFGALITAGVAKEPHPRMLGQVTEALEQLITCQSPVVICDDPAELDDWTAGALQSVLNEYRAPLLASRPLPTLAHGHPSLSVTPTVDIRLAPLEVEQLQSLAEVVLGAPFELAALIKVARASGGLPGLALPLLTISKLNGRIRCDSAGNYRVAGDLWSPELAWLAARLTEGVDKDLLQRATLLAERGPLALPAAECLLGAEQLTALIKAGIVRMVRHDDLTVVWLCAGLLADFLSQESASSPAPRYRPATGVPLERPRDRLSGGNLVIEHLSHGARLRVEAARQLWEPSPTPAHALPLLTALVQEGTPDDDIRYVIDHTILDDIEPSGVTFLLWTVRWLCLHGDSDAAVALAQTYPARDGDGVLVAQALETTVLMLQNRALPSTPLPDPVASGSKEPTIGQQLLRDVEIKIALLCGESHTAASLLASHDPTIPLLRTNAHALRSLQSLCEGNVATAVDQALEALHGTSFEDVADHAAMEMLGYATLLSLYLAGRVHDALVVAHDLLIVHPKCSDTYRNGSAAVGALVAHNEGRDRLARMWALEAEHPTGVPGPLPGMPASLVRAVLDGTLNPRVCADELWRLTGERLACGHTASALFIAVHAIERGNPPADIIERLVLSRASVESPLLELIARYLLAATAGDTGALTACAAEFAAMGASLLATKADLSLALQFRHRGARDLAATVAAAAWRQALQTGHATRAVFASLVEDIALSTREREIMQALARGMSYTDIAGAIGLSTSTVDTHLSNIAHKAGVPSRAQLTEAARTWLR